MPERNPSGMVYGILVVGTLLAAEGTQGIGYPRLVAAVAIALVLYWLAHAYSAVLGQRIASTDRWTPQRMIDALIHEFAIIRGSILPLVVLVIAGLLGAALGLGLFAVRLLLH